MCIYRRKIERDRTSGWRDSFRICALSEEDRHLGHVVRIGRGWDAFDSTHLNEARDGFRHLGTFLSVLGAKRAVELAAGYKMACEKAPASAGAVGRVFAETDQRGEALGCNPPPVSYAKKAILLA